MKAKHKKRPVRKTTEHIHDAVPSVCLHCFLLETKTAMHLNGYYNKHCVRCLLYKRPGIYLSYRVTSRFVDLLADMSLLDIYWCA